MGSYFVGLWGWVFFSLLGTSSPNSPARHFSSTRGPLEEEESGAEQGAAFGSRCPRVLAGHRSLRKDRSTAPCARGVRLRAQPPSCSASWVLCVAVTGHARFLPLFTGFAAMASPPTGVLPPRSPASLCPPAPRSTSWTRWQAPFNCRQLICCSFDEDY